MGRTEELRAAAELLVEDSDAVQAIYEGLHGALCLRETADCALVAPIFRDAIRAGLLRAQRLGED